MVSSYQLNCEVCGIKILDIKKTTKYCQEHRPIMKEYRKVIRFLMKEEFILLPWEYKRQINVYVYNPGMARRDRIKN